MTFWRDLEVFGRQPALLAENGAETSYQSLAVAADAAAASMSGMLPAQVDRPLILIETANAVPPIAAYLGALRAGWPVILASEGATEADRRIVETYRPNILFRKRSDGWAAELLERVPHVLHPELALLLSTSGTTGAAKLVRLSAGNLTANARSIAEYLEIGPDDRAITTLPFHYSYGMSVLHTHLLRGAALVLTERSLVDEAFWDIFLRNGVTSMALVPFQFDLLDNSAFERRALPTLKTVTQAGGKLSEPVVRRYAALSRRSGWRLFVMYGQTEAGPRMAYVPPEDLEANADTIGRAVPGGLFDLVGADGQSIAQNGVPGELVYRGPNVMMGYAMCLADLAKPAGPPVLHTGDVAERTATGYFRITGRLSRFVKMYGLRISLDEVEQRLRAEGVAAYAVGTDQRLTVFVAGEADRTAVRTDLVNAYGLTASGIRVEPIDDVPLLSSGKIDYRTLSERAARTETMAGAMDIGLAEVVSSALRGRPVDLNLSFVEHGGDSLAYLEVQLALQSRLGDVPPGWETMPLGTLERLAPVAPSRWQRVGADLVCRDLALLAVVALHTIALPVAGGVHVLLMLSGYSLARFQKPRLLSGAVGSMLRTMLLPIVTSYFVILGAVHVAAGPVDGAWFLLLGNFDEDIQPHGITPYWFVCLYVQALLLIALPFTGSWLRKWIGAQPLLAGLAALGALAAIVFALGLTAELGATSVRHPLVGLQLILLGWCIFHAVSSADRVLMAVLSAVLAALFLPAGATAPLLLMGAAAAVLWLGSLPVPRATARLATYVGKQSMYLYLSHVVVVAALTRLGGLPDGLLLAATLLISLAVAELLSRGVQTAIARVGPWTGLRSQDA